jgi:hypothetical protein
LSASAPSIHASISSGGRSSTSGICGSFDVSAKSTMRQRPSSGPQSASLAHSGAHMSVTMPFLGGGVVRGDPLFVSDRVCVVREVFVVLP